MSAASGSSGIPPWSLPRSDGKFEGLALDAALEKAGTKPMCGLQVVDIDAGQVMHWLRFEHTIEALFDVAILPGIHQPEAIGFRDEGIEAFVRVERKSERVSPAIPEWGNRSNRPTPINIEATTSSQIFPQRHFLWRNHPFRAILQAARKTDGFRDANQFIFDCR